MKTFLSGCRFLGLPRRQSDCDSSSLKKGNENGSPDKEDLTEGIYRILRHYYIPYLLYFTGQVEILGCIVQENTSFCTSTTRIFATLSDRIVVQVARTDEEAEIS